MIESEDLFAQAEAAKKNGAAKPEEQKVKLDITELFESRQIEKIAGELAKREMSLGSWLVPPEPAVVNPKAPQVKKPVGSVKTGDTEAPVFGLSQVLERVRENGKKGLQIQRYKGLGEMNPGQLWETTMDPARRTLLKVIIEDAVEADEIFTVLMGDDVEPRRQFIQSHAKQVTNLDV